LKKLWTINTLNFLDFGELDFDTSQRIIILISGRQSNSHKRIFTRQNRIKTFQNVDQLFEASQSDGLHKLDSTSVGWTRNTLDLNTSQTNMKAIFLLTLALFAIASVYGAAPANVTICTPAGAKAKIDSVKLVPDPPAKGVNKIYTSIELLETVTASQYKLEVLIGPVKVFERDHSACGNDSFNLPLGLGSVQVQGIPCPANAGTIQFVQTITLTGFKKLVDVLKSFDPILGSEETLVTVALTATDQNNNPLACVKIQFPKV